MTTLRTAAQQALEFLDAEFGWSPGEAPRIDALRAALTEEALQRFTDVSQEIEAALEPVQGPLIGRAATDVPVPVYVLKKAEPVQEPVAYAVGRTLHWHEGKGVNDAQLYLAAPPQRKPLTVMELQDALVYTNLIDPDAVNDPEGYDEGSTLAQIDELHRRLTT